MDYKEKKRLIDDVKLSVYINIIDSIFRNNDYEDMPSHEKLQVHTIVRYLTKLENKISGWVYIGTTSCTYSSLYIYQDYWRLVRT